MFNYTLAVQKFLAFLQMKQHTSWILDIASYQQYIENISKSLGKKRKTNTVRRKADQRSKTLPESLINKYFKSNVVKYVTICYYSYIC